MKKLILIFLPFVALGQVTTPLTVFPGATTDPGEIRLRETRSNGSNWVAIKSPSSVPANKAWTWPAIDGTLGQAIVTDGAGGLTWSSVSATSFPVCNSTTGNDTYTCTVSGFTAYSAGYCIVLYADTANTGTATVNISAVGAKSILRYGGSALSNSDILANTPVMICYDGTQFTLPPSASPGSGAFLDGGNSFGATATLGTNDAYDLRFERNNSTLVTLGAGGIDMAPGGVANFYNKVRKLEITGISGETAFWDIQAAANMASSSNFQIRDNAGSRAIRIDRAILGAPLNNILMYGNVIPQQRSTAGGDAVNDAVLPSLGTTSSPWTDLFLSNSVSARAFTSSDGTHTRISLNNPGAGSNAGSAWIVRDASGNIAGFLSYAGTLSATSVTAANVTASGATYLQTTGIGEASPAKGLLSVYGHNGYAYTPFNQVVAARFRTGANSAILFGTTIPNTSGWTRGMYWTYQTEDWTLSRFKDDESAAPINDLYVAADGRVGIGTASVTEELTVNGSIDVIGSGAIEIAGTTVINSSRAANFTGLTLGGSISATSTDTYDLGSSTRFRNIYGKSVNGASIEVANGTFVTTFWRHDLNGASTYRLSSGSGGQTEMQLTTTGSTQSDVGFRGTVYPLSTAGTNGDLGTPSFPWKSLYLSTGLRLTAGAAAGRVLTSDASGNATWAVAAGGVTSIATSSPISGGTITTTGTISCPTCFTTAGGTMSGSILAASTDSYDIGSSTRFRNVYGKAMNTASLEIANGTFVTTFWRHDLNGAATYRLSSGSGGQTEMQLGTTSSTQSDAGFRGTIYPLSTAGSNGDIGTNSNPWKSLYLSTAAYINGTQFIDSSRNLLNIGTITASFAITANGGISTGSATNSTIYIGSGNLYLRTFSGADASCSGVTSGWAGIRTDTDELQVCIGGSTKKVSLL